MDEINIAVLPGDGIGKEIMEACLRVLLKVQYKIGGYSLNYNRIDAGAEYYIKTGVDITESDFMACGEADAILFGSVGGYQYEKLDLEKRPERGLLRA